MNRKVPETDIPKDRTEWQPDWDDDREARERGAREHLEAGEIIAASNDGGIPHVWKAEDGQYRAILMQYRAVMENETFATLDDAVDWFMRMYYRTE